MPLQATGERTQLRGHTYISPDAETLLRQLVAQVAPTPIVRRNAEATEEVVFVAELDGARYTLIRSRPHTPTEQVSLSPRELAIAQLVTKGLPNKCIGDILEISPWTVATHLRRIFIKLDVTSRAAMVARLVEENLL